MADPVELPLLAQAPRPNATRTVDNEDRTSPQRQPSSHSSATPNDRHRTSSSIVASLFNEPLTDDSPLSGHTPGRASDDESSLNSGGSKSRKLGSKRRISTPRWLSKLRLWRHSDGIVPWLIIGSYILSIVLAVLHYVFFKVLDGRTTKGSFLQRQSTVNAISLLIVTAFRASTVYSVGACFAQYMWRSFRLYAYRVQLIEKLFQLRANIWELLNFKILKHAPLLFLIAMFTWLVPLAMVYPPGALSIQAEGRWRTTPTNVSTFNPEDGKTLELLATPDSLDHLSDGNVVYDRYYDPSEQSMRLMASVFTNSLVVSPVLPKCENCSYSLMFDGPLFRCESSSGEPGDYNATIDFIQNREQDLFLTTWSFIRPDRPFRNYSEQFFSYMRWKYLGAYIDAWGPEGPQIQLVRQSAWQSCHLFMATYSVNITFSQGIQSFTHSLDNERELQYPHAIEAFRGDNESLAYTVEHGYPPDGLMWESNYLDWRQETNCFSVMDLVGRGLTYEKKQSYDVAYYEEAGTYRLENGTLATLHGLKPSLTSLIHVPGVSFMENTVFNDNRFTYSDINDYMFEPARDINTTEARLNEVLLNLTLSTLSLGLWNRTVNMNESYVAAVYRFSDPLQLILPYSLCIGLTAAVLTIGLLALRRNGVAATDGGFLQIVTTTTGDNAMRRAALSGCLGGRWNAPEELMNMKVRFGELESESGSVRRAGFGKVDETVPLRRRVAYGEDLAD